MLELRWKPLDTWEPGAVWVCVGDQMPEHKMHGPLEKWARLEWREGEWHGMDWKPVKLAD